MRIVANHSKVVVAGVAIAPRVVVLEPEAWGRLHNPRPGTTLVIEADRPVRGVVVGDGLERFIELAADIAQRDVTVRYPRRVYLAGLVLPMPQTRGECVAGHPSTGSIDDRLAGRTRCAAWRCRHNLDTQVERPGRRNGGIEPPPAIQPRGPASCALDCVDASRSEPMTAQSVGEAIGQTRRNVQLILKRIAAKLQRAGCVVDVESFADLPTARARTAMEGL